MTRVIRKFVVCAAFLALDSLGVAQDKTPEPARMLVDQAVQKAKAQNKNVFIHFSASW